MTKIYRELLTLKNALILMQNSSCFRAPLKSERSHGSQTLLKPAWEHFYRNVPLAQDKLSWKISF